MPSHYISLFQGGGVTVITIGDEKDEICLPTVLNQRKRTEQAESPETTPPKNITVQRVLLDPLNTPPPGAFENTEPGFSDIKKVFKTLFDQ